MNDEIEIIPIKDRFRGFLPVVVDVETGGFNKEKDALLEIAAVTLRMDEKGELRVDRASMEVNGIKVDSPFRREIALPEHRALADFFKLVRKEITANKCTRAILVGHNAGFDLGFVNVAAERTGHKRNPFHPFSTFDTVTLGGMAYGQTVLARIAKRANISWDTSKAHSAAYDAEKTAEIFCKVLNNWQLFDISLNILDSKG